MAGYQLYRYSNEAEISNEDIYCDFKLKKSLWSGLCKSMSVLSDSI